MGNFHIGSTFAVKPFREVEFEYVTGEIMEIYLAILFSLLISGLIFLINAICCHTWTDLVEFLIIAAVWSVFCVFDVFFPVCRFPRQLCYINTLTFLCQPVFWKLFLLFLPSAAPMSLITVCGFLWLPVVSCRLTTLLS